MGRFPFNLLITKLVESDYETCNVARVSQGVSELITALTCRGEISSLRQYITCTYFIN